MPINKVSTVNAGVYTNPNTFSRSLSKAYENLGTQVNLMADGFAVGERAPVLDVIDARWLWNANPAVFGESINSISTGLDGTAMYTYAGTDYLSIDPIFLVYNPDNISEVRPATVYEAFQQTKSYVDTAITERTSAIIDIVTSLDVDLTGAVDGTLVISVSEVAAPSVWKVIADYGSLLDYGIVGPGGNKLIENIGYIGLEAPAIKFDTNYLDLAACDTVPTGPLAQRGRIYYNFIDNHLHLVNDNGLDTQIALEPDLFHHIEAFPDDVTATIAMTTDSTTYLVYADEDHNLTLPSISDLELGWEITIADTADSAATNNITINTQGGENFIGYGDYPLKIDTNSGLVRLQVTSQGWLILYTK
jgi:hypothetical protein